MAVNTKTKNDTTFQSPSQIAGQSFDQTYQVNVVEGLTINPVTGALERPTAIQGNASLSITESVDGTVTTTTIQKTIGDDVYQQTIEEDSDDNSVNVSVWSKL